MPSSTPQHDPSLPSLIVVPRGEHSPLGPSSSKRTINCPGSVNATINVKDGESIYAAEGTAAHFISELCRKQNKFAIDWLGCKVQADGFTFEVDEEFADSVQEFIDWCEEIDGTPLIEQRIDYSAYFPESTIKLYGPTFGTLDDARLRDEDVYITDFKHGKGAQEFAERNTQLLLQALGVWEAFNWLYKIKGFWLQICQPRLDHKDRWYVSVEDLLEWARETIPEWAARVELGIDFKAGDWCKFCRIRKTCAVRANAAVQLMLEEGEFEDLDNLEVHAMRGLNRAQFIDNEKLAKILPALDLFTKWIKDMKSRALTALIGGEKIGDWKIVEGRSNRVWKDNQEGGRSEVGAKLRSLGVDPYHEPKLISVAEAEKALGKKTFATSPLKEFVLKPQGKPKLAPGTDKRAAVTTTTLDEFENLDEE